jgi:hypothetical protein
VSVDASSWPVRCAAGPEVLASPQVDPERRHNLRRYAVDLFCDHLGGFLDDEVLALDEEDQQAYLTWLALELADGLLRYIQCWETDYPSVMEWRRLRG